MTTCQSNAGIRCIAANTCYPAVFLRLKLRVAPALLIPVRGCHDHDGYTEFRDCASTSRQYNLVLSIVAGIIMFCLVNKITMASSLSAASFGHADSFYPVPPIRSARISLWHFSCLRNGQPHLLADHCFLVALARSCLPRELHHNPP